MNWNKILNYVRVNKLFIITSLSILTIFSALFHLSYTNSRSLLLVNFEKKVDHAQDTILQHIEKENNKHKTILNFLKVNQSLVDIIYNAQKHLKKYSIIKGQLTTSERKKLLKPYHDKILTYLNSVWNASSKQHSQMLHYMHIQLAYENTSLLRLVKPNMYGGNFTKLHAMGSDANKTHEPISGIINGPIGPMSVVLQPVIRNGIMVGTIKLSTPMKTIIQHTKKNHLDGVTRNWNVSTKLKPEIFNNNIFKKSYKFPIYTNNTHFLEIQYQISTHDEIQALWNWYFLLAMILFAAYLLSNAAMVMTIKVYNRRLEDQISFRTQKLIDEIIKHKETTRQLETKTKEAYLNSKYAEIGELAAGIAHEINNPLMVIQATMFKLKKTTVQNNIAQTLITTATRNIARMSQIISSLKIYSRDGREDDMQNVDLKNILNNALDLVQINLKKNNVSMSSSLPDLQVTCQHVQLIQVFVNLIKNSCDAVAKLDDRWINISGEIVSDRLEIYFTDSGDGISTELHDKIFMNFFTTKEVGKGTGLGLSLVKDIMQRQNGTISIKPNCKNTTFTISLPYVQTQKQAA